MSLLEELEQIEELKEAEPIAESESKCFKVGRSEGAPYLFHDFEEYCDLMGHGVVFYSTGVLMYMKDKNKDFETSRSYVFHNNEKMEVLKAHNRRSQFNPETRTSKYLPPIKDIEVKVFEDYVYSRETMFETNEIKETLIEIATGKEVGIDDVKEALRNKGFEDFTIKDQLSFDI